MDQDDWSAAEVKYRESMALNPSLYLPCMAAGRAAFEAEQFDKAEKYFLKAKALVPAYGSERALVEERLAEIKRKGE